VAASNDAGTPKGDLAALNFVAGLVKSLPDNARPRTGTDTAGMITYLGTANGRFKIDAVLKVVSAQVTGDLGVRGKIGVPAHANAVPQNSRFAKKSPRPVRGMS